MLPEGVTPTTDRINLLRHGPEVTEQLAGSLPARAHPSGRAAARAQRRGHAGHQRHHPPARGADPRFRPPVRPGAVRHLSADRPFTESEREFLEQIREWGKKIVFIVNKIDILARPEERDEVIRYVRDNAAGAPGRDPGDLRRLGPPGAGRRPRRIATGGRPERAVGAERLRRGGGLPAQHARPAGAGPAQAAQPAQRRAPARVAGTRTPRSSGSSC